VRCVGCLKPTDFADDEYVIYRTCQQHMSYLVEFRDETDTLKPAPPLPVPLQSSVRQADMLIPMEDYTQGTLSRFLALSSCSSVWCSGDVAEKVAVGR